MHCDHGYGYASAISRLAERTVAEMALRASTPADLDIGHSAWLLDFSFRNARIYIVYTPALVESHMDGGPWWPRRGHSIGQVFRGHIIQLSRQRPGEGPGAGQTTRPLTRSK